MKMRKFTGATSREVLLQVRTELGPDALIVDNRSTGDGIEVTAVEGDVFERVVAPLLPAQPKIAPPPQQPADTSLVREVAALRELVTQQLAQLSWSDAIRRAPLRGEILRELLHAGFGADFARTLVQRLPDDYNPAQAQRWVANQIAGAIRCVSEADDVVARGGVYALTGATGVGKTTTAAKLAARCAVRHGAKSLALLTTDTYRVGAHDQLRIYAKILGVAIHTVNGPDDLRQALDSLGPKHLVLIDTVGMSQRDARIREHAALLAQPEVRRLLVLAATAQAETLDEVAQVYRGPPESFEGCIVTKLDEAVRVGDVLDVVVRHDLAIHFLSSGQRVPEDLHAPNATYLVNRALRAAAKHRNRVLDDDEATLMLGLTEITNA